MGIEFRVSYSDEEFLRLVKDFYRDVYEDFFKLVAIAERLENRDDTFAEEINYIREVNEMICDALYPVLYAENDTYAGSGDITDTTDEE